MTACLFVPVWVCNPGSVAILVVEHLSFCNTLSLGLDPCVGGKLLLAEAVGVALQVVHGLEELHSRNFVHEGLKPSNVLLDPRRQDVVLSDFAVNVRLHKLPTVQSKASIHYT